MNTEKRRQTKILATLGPATNNLDSINALIKAGVNIFRLNFSHGDHETHQKSVDMIRAASKGSDKMIGILADMQGPKLRLGEFKDGKIHLTEGQTFRFDLDPALGDETRVCLPHPEVMSVLQDGSLIFLDDGNVRARIIKTGDDYVEAEIQAGKTLSDRKGLNVPGEIIPLPALTPKDKTDLAAALDMGVDWIAQSFVQTAKDVQEARDLINGRASLMVKLEKPSAIEHLDAIIALSDGAMLARGDLGVEIPPEDVPAVQKRVIRTLREAGKPVVVATQMLESMIENARPTRAEASDVATAVYDGTDAVMLSAETAMGAHPIRAVEIMDKICRRTEGDETYEHMMDTAHPASGSDPSDAITTAAYYVAQDVEAKLIVTYTTSGSTAMRMARQRPDVPILCLTPDEQVANQMSVVYGVHAAHSPETAEEDFIGHASHAANIAVKRNLAKQGERFIMTAGMPFAVPGSTNLLRIAEVG